MPFVFSSGGKSRFFYLNLHGKKFPAMELVKCIDNTSLPRNGLSLPRIEQKDPKTLLQEYLQGRSLGLPLYEVTNITGQDHDQWFTVSCVIPPLGLTAEAQAKARKIAEQQCAQQLLEHIKSEKR